MIRRLEQWTTPWPSSLFTHWHQWVHLLQLNLTMLYKLADKQNNTCWNSHYFIHFLQYWGFCVLLYAHWDVSTVFFFRGLMGAFCQHCKAVCVSCRPEQAPSAGEGGGVGRKKVDGSEAWRCSSSTVTRDHTTRQQPFTLPLSFFFLSITLTESFPLSCWRWKRNFKVASGFHILSALRLIVLDTPSI